MARLKIPQRIAKIEKRLSKDNFVHNIEVQEPQNKVYDQLMVYVPQMHKHWIIGFDKKTGLEDELRNIQEDIYKIISKSGVYRIGLEGQPVGPISTENKNLIYNGIVMNSTEEIAKLIDKLSFQPNQPIPEFPLPIIYNNALRLFKDEISPLGSLGVAYNEDTLLMNLFYEKYFSRNPKPYDLQGIEKDLNPVKLLKHELDKINARNDGKVDKTSELFAIDEKENLQRSRDAVDFVTDSKSPESLVVMGGAHESQIKDYAGVIGLPLMIVTPKSLVAPMDRILRGIK